MKFANPCNRKHGATGTPAMSKNSPEPVNTARSAAMPSELAVFGPVAGSVGDEHGEA